MPSTFTLSDAADVALAPYLDREVLREDVRRRHYDADVGRSRGVCFSGMGPSPFQPRTEDQIRHDAEAACQKAEAFKVSPRGIFLSALKGIEQMPSHEYDAERLRSLLARDLSDDRQPLNVAAVGSALAILNEIPGRDARKAIDALAEMLLATRKEAA